MHVNGAPTGTSFGRIKQKCEEKPPTDNFQANNVKHTAIVRIVTQF